MNEEKYNKQIWWYPCNDLLNALLMTLHVHKCADLTESKVFPITKSNQLIKGTE